MSVALYALGVAAPYPLGASLNIPGASWAVLAGFRPVATLLHAAVYGLAVLCYALAIRSALRVAPVTRRVQTLIVGVWLACSLLLMGAYPGESTDVFDYLFRGRMLAQQGASPLAVVPSVYADQPLYNYVHWTHHVDTYGPLWEYLSWAVTALVAQGRWATEQRLLVATINGYRLLAIGIAGVCALLIATVVWRRTPALVPAALVAWLWNPLLLTATAVGAHNDLPMLLLLLLALRWFQRERWLLGLVALGLAAHLKLTALLVLPLLLLHLVRQRGGWYALRSGALAVLALLPLSWLLYAPLGGWATLPRMLEERVRLLANSLAYAAYWVLQLTGWREVDAWLVTTRGATLLFALAALPLLWWFWRAPRALPAAEDAHLWWATSALTVLYLAIGSFWFQHWYLLWALAPAALLPESRLTRVALPLGSLFTLWLHLGIDIAFTSRELSGTQPAYALLAQGIVLAGGVLLLGWIAMAWRTYGQDGARTP